MEMASVGANCGGPVSNQEPLFPAVAVLRLACEPRAAAAHGACPPEASWDPCTKGDTGGLA